MSAMALTETDDSVTDQENAAAAQVAEKRAFYQQVQVAQSYERQRFGGASGAWVNRREVDIVLSLIPPGGTVADIGCGTGRLAHALDARGDRVVGLDTSLAMLGLARGNGTACVQADAFHLPLRGGAFDGVTALRLLFHFAQPGPLLQEFRRLTRPGGTLVCDTYTWSPRSLIAVGRGQWGERVATIGCQTFRDLARDCGWSVAQEVPCFLFSPYVYRRLPLPLARSAARLERVVPSALLCRTFWALRAEPHP